jgi:NAD(P)-dependent dehydrogenase (short-subunit alcohol dehydrogenase family)
MKRGLQLSYWGAQPPTNHARLVAAAEDAGFDTVFTAEAWGSDAFTPLAPIEDGIRGMVAASATGRLGTPDEIAAAAAFLLGPNAAFITGIDLLVDGGVVASLQSGIGPRAAGPARPGVRL